MWTDMKRISLLLTGLALLALVGCSKPPDAEMQAANAAIEHARAAEAEMYVPDSWQMVQDSLNAAMAKKKEQDEKFALFRSYTDAKNMFVRAEALANDVATKSEAEKERVKNEVMTMLTTAQTAVQTATDALGKAPRGKGNKADLDLIKSDLEGVTAMLGDANNDFNAGKYLSAKTKTQQVIDRANAITQEIANAAAMKAGKK